MYERPWPVITAAAVGLLVGVLIGWLLLGNSNSDDASKQSAAAGAGPIRSIDGVPVGVEHSRAGALAAADNYVTTATETVVPDPAGYERLVRRTYARDYQATALKEAADARANAPEVVAAYERGRKALALVAARRLDSYTGDQATVTTWRAGVVWSSTDKPFSQWFLTRTKLRWDGEQWLVERIADVRRPAPAPPLRYQNPGSLRSATFQKELRGMTAPIYGTAR
jgi:hypothetical protein